MKTPWQLRMFRKTLKKQQRLAELKRHLGAIDAGEHCLLVTCGDNNGAINYYLSRIGGQWSFADLEDTCRAEMSELLATEVLPAEADRLPYADARFDRVVTIDVHEHLQDPLQFTREVSRVTRGGGQIICTVPNGDESRFAVRLKHVLGMTPDEYGHVRVGFTIPQLSRVMQQCGIEPQKTSSFSRLFTELLELSINFAYVKILAPRSKVHVDKGQIAPATGDQLRSMEKTYRLYSLIYPLYWLISRLDVLLPFSEGYVVVVAGQRPAG
ncbi:MAG TPA: methyltransferase domain-containing protein [Gammaproteobacteria bacterium]|nr:methyltransferase domain-containing protein [Gammaproteobacteria bacterium]